MKTNMEINRNCQMMQVLVQSRFDLFSDQDGIIGVTYNPEKEVYDFHLNTNRIASYRDTSIPREEIFLKEFLVDIAKTAANIVGMSGSSLEEDDEWDI